ncbi:MAG: hypothetical protein V3V52_04925 [Candidatus Adiutricales bacterium]
MPRKFQRLTVFPFTACPSMTGEIKELFAGVQPDAPTAIIHDG